MIRKVDTWSVFKISLLFFLCMLLVCMVAGVALWTAARQTGTITDLEKQIEKYAILTDFRFIGEKVFTAALLTGLVLVLLGTAVTTIAAVLYNLLSDIVGGVQIVMLEEVPASAVRRTVPAGDTPATGQRAVVTEATGSGGASASATAARTRAVPATNS